MSATATDKKQAILALADKVEKAAYGHEDATITQDDLNILGIKMQKTFQSKHYGRVNIEAGWESFCVFLYEKITGGEKHPGSVARGRGFQSQAYGRAVAQALRERADVLAEERQPNIAPGVVCRCDDDTVKTCPMHGCKR